MLSKIWFIAQCLSLAYSELDRMTDLKEIRLKEEILVQRLFNLYGVDNWEDFHEERLKKMISPEDFSKMINRMREEVDTYVNSNCLPV